MYIINKLKSYKILDNYLKQKEYLFGVEVVLTKYLKYYKGGFFVPISIQDCINKFEKEILDILSYYEDIPCEKCKGIGTIYCKDMLKVEVSCPVCKGVCLKLKEK